MSFLEFNDAIEGYLEANGVSKQAMNKPMTRVELDDLFAAAEKQSALIAKQRAERNVIKG